LKRIALLYLAFVAGAIVGAIIASAPSAGPTFFFYAVAFVLAVLAIVEVSSENEQ